MNLLFIGDVVGRPGRDAVQHWLPKLRAEFPIDVVVANAENAAGGVGATAEVVDALARLGVQAFTLGNHTWRRKSFVTEIERYPNLVRPANYPANVPGQGWAAIPLPDGRKLGLVNVLGRVFLDPFDCPFAAASEAIDALRAETKTILVDVHAEATSEKVALGWYLDGQCSAVVGTHTHVQTADERILPRGTAYITDVGMTGPLDSVIGVEKGAIIERFLTGLPMEFAVAQGRAGLNGVYLEIDDVTGTAQSIARIQRASD
jgi:metallophosphoesterase (TIGR00282 family)